MRYLAILVNITLIDALLDLLIRNRCRPRRQLRHPPHQFGLDLLLLEKDPLDEIVRLVHVQVAAHIVVVLLPDLVHDVLDHLLVLFQVHFADQAGDVDALLVGFVLEEAEDDDRHI